MHIPLFLMLILAFHVSISYHALFPLLDVHTATHGLICVIMMYILTAATSFI